MIYYMCKYSPVELFAGFGEECVRLESMAAESFETAESLGHANMCGYGKGVLEAAMDPKVREIILVNCCDVVRRVYDILKVHKDADFLYLLDLPHKRGRADLRHMERELSKLIRAYEEKSGRKFDAAAAVRALTGSTGCGICCEPDPEADRNGSGGSHMTEDDRNGSGEPHLTEAERNGSGEPLVTEAQKRSSRDTVIGENEKNGFISLLGAHSSLHLREMIRSHFSVPVVDDTCTGNRVIEGKVTTENFVEEYAAALLNQVPCMRMADASPREQLGQGANGIIYHTMKFCDYYGFEYSNLKKTKGDAPVLKIETDGTKQSEGQLATRLDAFAESLHMKEEKKKENRSGRFAAGVDSGSASTDAVILDENGKIVGWSVMRTGSGAAEGARKALDEALQMAGITREDLKNVVSTGYGRDTIGVGDDSVTEITCHAKGANYLDPKVRTIIDIGGQDSKVIKVDGKGAVLNFVMNDKCAAGTGRFLEMMARTMEMSMEDMSALGLKWKNEVQISSMCTVFAESEVVSLIAGNTPPADIVHGLNKSVANRTASLVRRVEGQAAFMMTGGVAKNKGVVDALEKKLGEKIVVSEYAQLCGAIGAALIAAGE